MVTEEEKVEIIDKAVEKALLLLPKVVSNLMMEHNLAKSLNEDFYSKYPEFTEHKDIVTSVIEHVDGNNPLIGLDKILEKSVPEIRERIKVKESLNTVEVSSTINRRIVE
jgi:hypothetical protein